MVKANAYGHGAKIVAAALERSGVDWLGVALVEEGIELRLSGVRAPVLVFDGAYGRDYEALFEGELTPILFREDHLEGLSAAAKRIGRSAVGHLKVDTGMGRVGVLPAEVAAFAEKAKQGGVAIDGVCTHFSNADLGDVEMVRRQVAAFDEALLAVRRAGHTPRWIHLANSAATVDRPESHRSLVRPGLSLYGYVASPRFAEGLGLRPVMRWTTEVLQVKAVPAGFPVSYGGTFVTRRPSRLATLGVGYADGYRRALSNKGEVLVRGQRAQVAGRVTMDLVVVDVTDVPGVAPGDEVVLIGRQGEQEITADELAEHCETNSYEILCGVSARVPRVATGT
jgi:alanine racemase